MMIRRWMPGPVSSVLIAILLCHSISLADGTASSTQPQPTATSDAGPAIKAVVIKEGNRIVKGATVHVRAELAGGITTLPSGCSIVWGGDAEFANQDGLTTDANLPKMGSGMQITACLSTGGQTVRSAPIIVYELTQFNWKPGTWPKCIGEPLTRDDFVAIVNPTGLEDKIHFDFSAGTDHAGTFKAAASLPGGQPLYAEYKVLEPGEWAAYTKWVPETEVLTAGPTVSVNKHKGFFFSYWIKTQVSYSGPTEWKQIGQDVVQGGFNDREWDLTAKSIPWGGADEKPTQFDLSLPWVVGEKLTTWAMNVGFASGVRMTGPRKLDGPYMWRFTTYQQVWKVQRTVKTWRSSVDPMGGGGYWVPSSEGDKYCVSLGDKGTGSFATTMERQCPP